MPTEDSAKKIPGKCSYPWQSLIIQADGSALPCCHNRKPPFFYGNANTQSLDELWNSEGFRSLRQAFVDGDIRNTGCENCVLFDLHNGRAPDFMTKIDPGSRDESFRENLALSEREFVRGDITVSSKPTILQFIPTNACNIQCDFCYQRKVKGDRLEKNAHEIFDAIVPYLQNLVWMGGEITLNKKFHDWVDSFIRDPKTMEITLISNGTYLDANLERLFSEAPQSSIYIAIDAHEKELYEILRKGGTWEVTYDNIKRLIAIRDAHPSFKVVLQVVLQKANLPTLPSFLEFCQHHEIPVQVGQLNGSPITGLLDVFEDPGQELPSDIEAILDNSIRQAAKLDAQMSDRSQPANAEALVRRCVGIVRRGLADFGSLSKVSLSVAPGLSGAIAVVRNGDGSRLLSYANVRTDGRLVLRVPATGDFGLSFYGDGHLDELIEDCGIVHICESGAVVRNDGRPLDSLYLSDDLIRIIVRKEGNRWSWVADHLKRTLQNDQKVLIWGGGSHTRDLLDRTELGRSDRVAGVICHHPDNIGRKIGKYEVLAPSTIDTFGADIPIVISSYSFERQIASAIPGYLNRSRRIVTIYGQ